MAEWLHCGRGRICACTTSPALMEHPVCGQETTYIAPCAIAKMSDSGNLVGSLPRPKINCPNKSLLSGSRKEFSVCFLFCSSFIAISVIFGSPYDARRSCHKGLFSKKCRSSGTWPTIPLYYCRASITFIVSPTSTSCSKKPYLCEKANSPRTFKQSALSCPREGSLTHIKCKKMQQISKITDCSSVCVLIKFSNHNSLHIFNPRTHLLHTSKAIRDHCHALHCCMFPFSDFCKDVRGIFWREDTVKFCLPEPIPWSKNVPSCSGRSKWKLIRSYTNNRSCRRNLSVNKAWVETTNELIRQNMRAHHIYDVSGSNHLAFGLWTRPILSTIS